jgi:DNA-binding LacI/PurR family transcriptional regulator
MRALLALRDRPTAVFCASDLIALGAHKACAAAGFVLPRDISLIGCDAIEMGALVSPELSTIDTPRREVGALAVRMLVQQLEGAAPLRPPARTLAVQLVPRGSTGPAPTSPAAGAGR